MIGVEAQQSTSAAHPRLTDRAAGVAVSRREWLRPTESYRAEGQLVPLPSPTERVSAIRCVDYARELAFPGYRAICRNVWSILL